ncbi:hypothetical protein YC2023_047630 [Brassica napus]
MASKLGILRYDMASFVFTYWINYWARQWVSWFAPFIKTSHNNVSHLSFLVNNLWKQILSNVYSSILAFLIRKLKLKVPSSKELQEVAPCGCNKRLECGKHSRGKQIKRGRDADKTPQSKHTHKFGHSGPFHYCYYSHTPFSNEPLIVRWNPDFRKTDIYFSILRTFSGRQLPFLKLFNYPLSYAATGYRFLPFSFSVPHAVRTTCFTGKTTKARVRVLLCSLLNVFTPRVASSKKSKGYKY